MYDISIMYIYTLYVLYIHKHSIYNIYTYI